MGAVGWAQHAPTPPQHHGHAWDTAVLQHPRETQLPGAPGAVGGDVRPPQKQGGPPRTCSEVSMQLETRMSSQKSRWKKWAIL